LLNDQTTVVWRVPPEGDDTSPYLCEVTFLRPVCAECGVQHELNANPPRRVYDLPSGDHPVILEITEGHTCCPQTGQVVLYKAPHEHCTDRLIRYLQRHHGHETHRELAKRVGVTPSQVLKYQKRAEIREPQREVVNLGLDDLYVFKQRFVVATDLDTGKLLLLEPGAPMIQGKADQMDFDQVLAKLPKPQSVAVDMHQGQLDAVKRTWPNATVVIDKRHLLQTIDRDLIQLVGNVVLVWRSQNSESFSVPQVLRPFGAAAYPYLALRTLVLRRQALLTPADHAAWLLLRREAGEAQLLWEAYQWREALYDIYDARLTGTRFEEELKRWRREIGTWRESVSSNGHDGRRTLFSRILWALNAHWAECSAYGHARLTNARTELVNAKIRRYVRRGHRYSPETLLNLINRDLDLSGALPVPDFLFAKEEESKTVGNMKPESSGSSLHLQSSVDQSLMDTQAVLTLKPRRGRTSRHRPKRHESIKLADPIWEWLHSPKEPGRRQGKRWYHVLMAAAPPRDRWAWHLLCRGQCRGEQSEAGVLEVTSTQMTHWRLSVLFTYFRDREQFEPLNSAEYQPLIRMKNLDVDRLMIENPVLATQLDEAWCSLTAESYRYEKLIMLDRKALVDAERWCRIDRAARSRRSDATVTSEAHT
jgi:hypothetical protein